MNNGRLMKDFVPNNPVVINGKKESYVSDPNAKQRLGDFQEEAYIIHQALDKIILMFEELRNSASGRPAQYRLEIGQNIEPYIDWSYNVNKLTMNKFSYIFFNKYKLMIRFNGTDATSIRGIECFSNNKMFYIFNEKLTPELNDIVVSKLKNIYELIEDCFEESLYDISNGMLLIS